MARPPLRSGIEEELSQRGFFVKCVDYKATTTSPLVDNAEHIASQILGFVDTYRWIGRVAAVQADVVAHSMGGLLVRALPIFHSGIYYDDSNFHKGFIHKAICIGTPHNGSEWAQMLIDIGSILDFSRTAILIVIIAAITGFSDSLDPNLLEAALSEVFNGALSDLDADLERNIVLRHMNSQPLVIPTYNLVGIASDVEETSEVMLLLLQLLTSLANEPIESFQQFFGGDSDLIVSESSQRGVGLSPTPGSSEIGEPVVHASGLGGTGELESNATLEEIVTLLNLPVCDWEFSATNEKGVPPTGGGRPTERGEIPTSLPLLVNRTDPGIAITSPPDGVTTAVGDVLAVEVEVVGDITDRWRAAASGQ